MGNSRRFETTMIKEILKKIIELNIKRDKEIKNYVFNELTKINHPWETLSKSPKVKLSRLPLTQKFINEKLLPWLWYSGFLPIAYEELEIEGKKIYLIYVPGEQYTIYQVILFEDGKELYYFCGCQHVRRIQSWLGTYGVCSHILRAWYWITGEYEKLFNKLDEKKKEKKVQSLQNKLNKLKNAYKDNKLEIIYPTKEAIKTGLVVHTLTYKKLVKLLERLHMLRDKILLNDVQEH